MPDAKLPRAQGKPCWLDYFAEDQNAAIAFYHELFGWTGEPNEEFGGYAVLRVGEYAAAGIARREAGSPPTAWNTYFMVDDIAAVADRIDKLGGTKFVGPDEVPGTGTMVVAADPAGAPFGLWQPGPFVGFEGEREAGLPAWFELETHEGARSAEFLESLFGVQAATGPEMVGEYWIVSAAGEQAAGIWQDPDAEGPPAGGPHWNPYFQVADTDATVAKAVAAGGSVLIEAKDSPYGRMAKLRDPQGAEFSVIAPAF
jgi:uncharacterized protein